MTVLNELDRFHLAGLAIDRISGLRNIAAYAHQDIRKRLVAHTEYVRTYGEDMPEIRNWKWSGTTPAHKPVLLHTDHKP
jgi:xylulose-5-phosphate/fructose-6-phosphate phosphoketolase